MLIQRPNLKLYCANWKFSFIRKKSSLLQGLVPTKISKFEKLHLNPDCSKLCIKLARSSLKIHSPPEFSYFSTLSLVLFSNNVGGVGCSLRSPPLN